MNSNDPTHLGEPGLMPGDRECDVIQPVGWQCVKCKRGCRLVSDPVWPPIKSSHCCDALALAVYETEDERWIFELRF